MTTDPRTGMTVLDEDACWSLLGSASIARVAVAIAGDVEVFPVNIVVDERTVVFRTGEGTKLAASVIAPRVAVEADGVDPARGRAWSVVVKGRAERLERFTDIYRAEDLALPSWTEHPKQWFVRVYCDQITGRSFQTASA
ncbi:pyridoxamine 5'-phosphate oxidase family protein [Jiangella mangrovi]|uniref:Nitroimidazol reductase NimA-like FMN-containing flavoprotein (Pyridoxamine 5'-phosphate oxidase superfamily) n=1 Tax=Jiangella mangrovi TaxID=1524084 RepID=A0A7W9GRM5_9ACTN|nr:nitroimidazol reductase NimA-like FMN-containing flavoprotein (pyridoxamine 5'-phosphate oxidase superfamily) [Jiangella mangrovi]